MSPEELLRTHGLRVTRPRVAVLRVLEAAEHLEVEEIHRRVEDVSLQAVYDVLAALTAAGLARRIEPAGGTAALYERDRGDRHHHLVCRRCHTIVDVPHITGDAACLTPSAQKGFLIEAAEVTFWGTCPRCRQSETPASSAPAV